jgi:16S rRNA (cytosine967-C5)-methyltransferase
MNARKLAHLALNKITYEKAYSNIILNDLLRKYPLSSEDAAFCTKLFYGTIQNKLYLDYQLEPYLKQKKQMPWVINLLRLALYQMFFLSVPDYAAINETVALAKKKNKALGSFVNAVLRNVQRNGKRLLEGLEPLERISIEYSYPLWLTELFVRDYGLPDTEKIFAAEKEERPLFIRINRLKGTKAEVEDALKAAYDLEETLLPLAYRTTGAVQKAQIFLSGKITIQDLSAQYVSIILAPEKTDKVIDLCAAPGGKAAHLADLMENQGEIIACDIHPHKLELMEKGFKRLGVENVKTRLLDARRANEAFPKHSFDKVLADVPCSGLGVISHKPDIKFSLDKNTINELVSLQREILEAGWELLKPGGDFVYSTCTLNREENEEQIKEFLKRHPEAEIVETKKILPYEYNSDGFYICKLRRLS